MRNRYRFIGASLALALTSTLQAASPARALPQDALESLAASCVDADEPSIYGEIAVLLKGLSERGATSDDDIVTAECKLALAASIANSDWYEGIWPAVLRDVDLSQLPPTVRARAAWLTGASESLQVLGAWQMIGPFDNDRGRGMTRRGDVEKDASSDEYDGKVRPVRWRTLPAPGPNGASRLSDFLYPADQVCAVLRTWVFSKGAREACFLFAAAEEARVWCNGEHVYDALNSHSMRGEAHAVRVALRGGWNEITMKIGGQDAAPSFIARLVEPSTGEPLALRSAGSLPEGATLSELARVGRSAKTPGRMAPPGAHEILERRLAERPDDVDTLISLALLRHADGTGPRQSRPGLDEASRALTLSPDSLATTFIYLEILGQKNGLSSEEDANPWLKALRSALATHGDRVRWLMQYARFASRDQRLPERALALADRAVAASPDSILARAFRCEQLGNVGQGTLIAPLRGELLADPAIHSFPRIAYSLGSSLPGHDPRRLAMIRSAAESGLREAAKALRDLEYVAGRIDGAAALESALGERLALYPNDVNMIAQAANRHLSAGRYDAALAHIDQALSLCPERPDLHATRSRALLMLGDETGAIAALEATVAYDESRTDEIRLLEHLRTSTNGASSGSDPSGSAGEVGFHVAFAEPLDDILARRVADEPLADQSAAREVLLHRFAVEVGSDGRARRYRRVVERVLTRVGARELDRRGFRAYPGDEEVRVLNAVVRHPDGTEESARTGRTGRRGSIVIDLPPLEPGDIVDLEWRRDDLRPSIFGTYFGLDAGFVPDGRLAVREAEISVIEGDGVDLAYHVTGTEAPSMGIAEETLETEDGRPMRRWRATGLSPRRTESLEPPGIERSARVQASTYATWEEFGTWWWNLIREEITTSPEMREKVAELVANKTEPLERLRAIYDFVVTDIRYNAWEFGIHGYEPYSAPVIFSRRFGDCKDKAILLRAMLGEAGIESWPVVVRSAGRRYEEDIELPLIAHFNHCIAHVPAQDGIPEMFLDGTATLHPLEVLPDADRGAKVVTVREDGAETMRIPFPTAEQNTMRARWTVDLTSEDGASIRLEREPSGRWDPRERYLFAGDEAERAESVENVLTSQFGALRGAPTAEHPDYEDLTRPLRVVMTAEPERVGREIDTGRELPTTFEPLKLVSSIASESERTTDVLLDVPWSTDRAIEYQLPAGAKVGALPAPVMIQSEDLMYKRTVERSTSEDGKASSIIVRETFRLPGQRIPVARYDAFRQAARRVDEAQRAVIRMEVGQ